MEVADKVLDGHVVKTDCQNCKCQIDTTRLDNVKSGSLVDIRPLIKLRLIPQLIYNRSPEEANSVQHTVTILTLVAFKLSFNGITFAHKTSSAKLVLPQK